MNNLKFIFMFILIYASLVGWSSNGWVTIWFMMEVVFLGFVGLCLSGVSYLSVEFMMKYFIIQVFVSFMFLALFLFCLFNLSLSLSSILVIVLMMKLGLFPFHLWMIMVLGKLDWISFFLFLTAVKLVPLVLIYYLNDCLNLFFVLLISSVVGGVLGMNNVMIQKLLGYSSLVHLCWLILSLEISVKIFVIYFVCYVTMMLLLSLGFNLMNFYYLNQFKVFALNYVFKFFVFFLSMSFAGFPPFLGFLAKWVVVSSFLFLDAKALIFCVLFFSLFMAVLYLEMFYYLMMMGGIGVLWYRSFFWLPGGGLFFVLTFFFLIYLLI